MFRGSITALLTPSAKSGGFDEKAFPAFVDWPIAEVTTGLVRRHDGQSPRSRTTSTGWSSVCVGSQGQGAGDS